MRFTPSNTAIFIGYLILIIIGIWKLLTIGRKHKTYQYFFAFLVTASLITVQVLLMDFGFNRKHTWVLGFFLPYQYASPVYFTAFLAYYLKRKTIYTKNRKYLFIPFAAFFVLYTVLKINIALDYAWISRKVFTFIHTEIDENTAMVFTTVMSIWNLKMILDYENDLGDYSFAQVKQKTKWIKTIVGLLIAFNVLWILTIILFVIREDISGHVPYYPYWILYLVFYYVILYLGTRHIQNINSEKETAELETQDLLGNFQLSGMQHLFNTEELLLLQKQTKETTAILCYFATSLFDKNKTEEVLWDITENCISLLGLEDCVIYLLNDQNVLEQKAAYGNKNLGAHKILTPIEIPLGQGIVGEVATTGSFECITDVTEDQRYIKDDKNRRSELAVPIFQEDAVIGVLDSEHSESGFFTEKHVLLFQLIAKLIGKKLAKIKDKQRQSVTNDNVYFKELHFLMKEAKIYQDPALSLENISERLNISSNYLSQLVNKLSGQSFPEYVNGFRIKDAQAKLIDPEYTHYTILSIAMESGFNSKSAFYNAFKKKTGMSPSQFKKNVTTILTS